MDEILKYFPELKDQQRNQFNMLDSLYREWNQKINVISRKDIDKLYLHHVLHSLAIAKWIQFRPETKILDVGCGGGFPGIPLAIYFPHINFHLVDSIGKKLKVVDAVADELSLTNVRTSHTRAEELKTSYDFIISRAVAPLSKLVHWTGKKISNNHKNAIPNGLIALKGGDLKDEITQLPRGVYTESKAISDFFEEEYFDQKYIIYVQV